MPGLPGKMIVWWERAKLVVRPGLIEPKPVYAAAGLLLVAGVLMAAVVGGLKGAVTIPEHAVRTETVGEPQPVGVKEAPAAAVQQQEPQHEEKQVAAASTAAQAAGVAEIPRWPIKGEILVDRGWRIHPVFNDWRYHNGIDIKGREGQQVVAALSGEVEDVYTDRTSGLTVVIKSRGYTFYYGCLSGVSVDKNSKIQAGVKVGTAGSSSAEPYPHLHLAVKKGDKYIDPREILK